MGTPDRASLSMEYIPDGLTKAQWTALKKKEEDEQKAKGNLGALGTTRFKSRSLEAWQKSGGKHLFPVDPRTTPYEERPYMQRKGGDFGGTDLERKGMVGKGQGEASKVNKIDEYYQTLKSKGKLDSASILGTGEGLPWTQKQVNKVGKTATASKKLSEEQLANRKKNVAKVYNSKKNPKKSVSASTADREEPTKKKG